MTNPRQLTRRHDDITATYRAITDRLPRAIKALRDRTGSLDGFPTSASGSDSGPGGHTTTSITEATAIARLEGHNNRPGPVELVMRLNSAFVDAHDSLIHALTIIDQLVPRDSAESVRCVGDGTASGVGCTNVATGRHKGMCIACYSRARRRAV